MIESEQIIPISDLRVRQSAVLQKLQDGPVYLAQRSKPVAVLLSAGLFDHLLAQLEDKDDLIAALKAELRLARGESVAEEIDLEQLEAGLNGVPT